ncbi:MAG: sugar phosphate isomerase/epimerase [Clostridia bacterium]|nr:sugar phosphate isomerase/epimerase [Clostridia bacterium]
MKICVDTAPMVAKYGEAEALRRIADCGFDGVDFGMFHYDMDGELFRRSDEDFMAFFADLYEVAKSAGLEISQVHSPMPSWVTDQSRNPHIWACQKKSILAAAAMHSPYIVIHPCIPPQYRYDFYRAESRAINKEFFTLLQPTLIERGVKLGVENMFNWDPEKECICPTVCSSAEEMNDYADMMGEGFCVCLDVGHSSLSGEAAGTMVRKIGKRLELLHVHDNNGKSDQHTAPMLGLNGKGMSSVDWDDFAAALHEVGYQGTLSFETDTFQKMYGPDLLMESTRMLAAIARNFVEKYHF